MAWMLIGRAKLVDGTDSWRQDAKALLPEDVTLQTGWPDIGDAVVLAFGARGGLAGRLGEIREALAPMFVGAPMWCEANDVGVWPLQKAPSNVAEVRKANDDLREWQNEGNGCAVCIDRRAVSSVADGGMNGGCVVTAGGWPVALLDGYADVVAWWRGGR